MAEWASVAEAVAAATLVVAAASVALLVAALVQRQPSTVVAFERRRLSGVHTLPAEVLADQLSHLDSITVALACLPYNRADSIAQLVGLQVRTWADSLLRIGSRPG